MAAAPAVDENPVAQSSPRATGDDAAIAEAEAAAKRRRIAFQPLGHRDDVDGLRALAVIPVVLYHFTCGGFVGGFAGVDVFFTISGFLITSIILTKLERGSFSLAEFWQRRCRRLFPALATVLAAVLAVGWFTLLGDTYTSLLQQGWATLLFSANFQLYLSNPYFMSSIEVPLLHMWSLAVEEQFYLLFPLMLCTIYTRSAQPQRSILAALVATTVLSFAISIAYTSSSPNFAFYLLPARAWELCVGGLLAFDGSSVFSETRAAEAGSWAGILMMMASFLFVDESTAWPGYAALLPVLGAALVIASNRQERLTSAGRCLAHPCAVAVGRISYSLYLWHWPIFVLMVQQSSSADNTLSSGESIFGIALSALAAVLSYHLVEQTTRAASKVSHETFFTVAGSVWLLLLMFCVVCGAAEVGGIRSAATDAPRALRNLTAIAFEDSGHSGHCMRMRTEQEIDQLFHVEPATISVDSILSSRGWEAGRFNFATAGNRPYIVGPAAAKPTVAIIGTSHCEMYGPLIEELASEYGTTVGFLCRDADMGRFRKSGNEAWDRTRLQYLDAWQPEQLIYIDFWAGDTAAPWWYDGHDWNATMALLAPQALHVKVFGDVPTLPITKRPSNDLFKNFCFRQYQERGSFDFLVELEEAPDYAARRRDQEAEIARAASAHSNANFIPVAPYFTHAETGKLQVVNPDTGTLAYKDFGHLNIDGAEMVEQLFRRELFDQPTCP